jgi:hypothetical protein
LFVAGAGKYDVFGALRRGFVTVQPDGTGTMAGLPARVTISNTGSAETSEQRFAAVMIIALRMAANKGSV